MAKPKEPINPFYLLLVVVGVLFFITACAYGVMTFQAARGSGLSGLGESSLNEFLKRHGEMALGIEVGVLLIATLGAMAIDRRRQQS